MKNLQITEQQLRKIIRNELELQERVAGKGKGRFKAVKDKVGNFFNDDDDDDVEAGPASAGNAAKNAEKELEFWGGKDEKNPKVQTRLQQYADHVKGGRGFFPKKPWSAGFISWLFRDDPAFKKSAAHATYMRDAKKNREAGKKKGYLAFKPEEIEKLAPGDLACYPRGGEDGFDNIGAANHCDVAINDKEVVGGNLGDTAKKVSYDPNKVSMVIRNVAEGKQLSESDLRFLVREGIKYYNYMKEMSDE